MALTWQLRDYDGEFFARELDTFVRSAYSTRTRICIRSIIGAILAPWTRALHR